MEIFQAIILGLIQGLTEFLPISSSAHLYLVPYIFGWDYQGLGFDVALHWGTLLAVIWIFWRDYLAALKNPKMLGFLIVGSLPAAAAGFFLKDQAETVFHHPLVTVITLSGFGLLLWYADKKSTPHLTSPTRGEEKRGDFPPPGGEGLREGGKLTLPKSLFIGVGQALALVPGVSRAGATITAGLLANLNRESAVRFSFLLSGPVIFGAGLVKLSDMPPVSAALVAGFAAAALSGFVAIKFLLRYVAAKNFNIFVWYRLALSAAVLFIFLTRT